MGDFDFKKRLGQKAVADRLIDPIALYETLDRESDKGPLREPQRAVLRTWFDKRRVEQDLILKMHTGQGKTLVGLLALQSQLNAGKGPALYLCASHFLADQTQRQAEQFGFKVTQLDREIPNDFLEGKRILISIPQKLFNGETKFGMNAKSARVGTLLLDDAHACVDIIREQFTIRLAKEQNAYTALRNLFATDLEAQGAGTYEELLANEYDAILPVPYWAWREKKREVTSVLAAARDVKSVQFAWPMLKDNLEHCTCVFSGHALEIGPVIPPLEQFGTYVKAAHRIFMSATVANDAFLVKALGVSADSVRSPLVYEQETWSGEKMILVPSLVEESLDRSAIVNWIAKPTTKRSFGVAGLAPSFAKTGDWESLGAVVAKPENIDSVVQKLRTPGERDAAVVFANRYDGVDLPDAACRILVFDSKPFAEALWDRYMERCLGDVDTIAMATARKIEQGLGRSVRGEKDYSVILMIGNDLVKHVVGQGLRRHLSAQTRQQIEIGFEVAEMAREQLGEDAKPLNVLIKAINLCLGRDEGWKEFYVQRMNEMSVATHDSRTLDLFVREREAELKFQNGDIDKARSILQHLSDLPSTSEPAKGWYLQECARYEFGRSKTDANMLQIAAHKRNRALLRPRTGMEFKQITLLSQKRIENIKRWIAGHETGKDLSVAVDSILAALHFGVGSERFESAVDDLGRALGFVCERPDRDWKEGPDNLWALRDSQYLLIECKSEVDLNRAEINKHETDQMNRSSDWFRKNYGEVDVTRLMIIPTKTVSASAALRDKTVIMREPKLYALAQNVRAFFREFGNVDLKDIDVQRIQGLLATHKLDVDQLVSLYAEKPFNKRRPA